MHDVAKTCLLYIFLDIGHGFTTVNRGLIRNKYFQNFLPLFAPTVYTYSSKQQTRKTGESKNRQKLNLQKWHTAFWTAFFLSYSI